jgi:hypothetical protein
VDELNGAIRTNRHQAQGNELSKQLLEAGLVQSCVGGMSPEVLTRHPGPAGVKRQATPGEEAADMLAFMATKEGCVKSAAVKPPDTRSRPLLGFMSRRIRSGSRPTARSHAIAGVQLELRRRGDAASNVAHSTVRRRGNRDDWRGAVVLARLVPAHHGQHHLLHTASIS